MCPQLKFVPPNLSFITINLFLHLSAFILSLHLQFHLPLIWELRLSSTSSSAVPVKSNLGLNKERRNWELIQLQPNLKMGAKKPTLLFFLCSLADLTPEEKARGLARAIRKQTGEVRERWERLKGHIGGWQSQVDQALERLQELQSSMDQLDLRLTQAEEAKAAWQPVGDLLIDALQDHIDKTVVSQRHSGSIPLSQLTLQSSRTQVFFILLDFNILKRHLSVWFTICWFSSKVGAAKFDFVL